MDDIHRRERFERLFSAHHAAVLAYSLRRAPRDVAEEITNDTFVVAWRKLEDLPPAELPWLLGVARRILANRRRSASRSHALIERLGAMSRPVAEYDDQREGELDQRLTSALGKLTPREREAVLLIAWEELTPTQAAQVVGCSAAGMRLRLHRARKRLANDLRPELQRRAADTPAIPNSERTLHDHGRSA